MESQQEDKNNPDLSRFQEPEKQNKTRPLAYAGMVVAFALVLVVAVLFITNSFPTENNSTPPGTILVNNPGSPSNQNPNENQDYVAEDYDPLVEEKCEVRPASKIRLSGLVEWKSPVRRKDLNIVRSELTSGVGSNFYSERVYEVGDFVSGTYKGGKMLLINPVPNGPSDSVMLRAAYKDNVYYILSQYNIGTDFSAILEDSSANLQNDTTTRISELDMPSTLALKDYNLTLNYVKARGFYQSGVQFFCGDKKQVVATDPVYGDIYTNSTPESPKDIYNQGYFGFYLASPDGTLHSYTFTPVFVGEDNVPLITWLGDGVNKAEYSYQAVGGCGPSQFFDVINGYVNKSELKQTGTAISGDPIFEIQNTKHQLLTEMYNALYNPESKTSYDTFVKEHPLIIWEDPLGRLIMLKSTKYLPLAECGKPVIYLYPETEQKINVKLELEGGFSVTEPPYPANGWNVIAKPNGELKNLSDNKTYPYLFWEGRGSLYQTPKTGFVVTQNEVESFLTTTLAKLGLNQQETKDFLEFWLPRMQSSPYYFITFVPQSIIDRLAPLTVTPAPDTTIRVLMDFLPLEKPMKVRGFPIQTPKREGFTVVEWGGVLR